MGRHLFLATFLLAAVGLCSTASAQIQGDQSSQRLVTLAARECDDYDDIRANLARNDIQESLQDLGADTLYEPGDPVDPVREAAGQPTCRPITGWRFTFGDAIADPVTGPWGSLSVVTHPDGDLPVTQASVPLRDWDGHPVGQTHIAGAVTVGLTDAQIDRASRNTLWVQGGTTTDPVLYTTPPFAGRYGFGALRCSVDDLNGDNVETVAFPSGTRHAFCYAYYVTPPPSSGTIVIRKQVEGSDAPETFTYSGNLSYNAGGAFSISASDGAPGSMEFVRGETRPGDAPWTIVEDERDGWTLTGLTCTSQTGASSTTTSPVARTAQITLGAGDTVTCTYVNRLTPPAGVLVLRKVTRDGTGSFRFGVRAGDGGLVARPTLTTREPGGIGAVRPMRLEPGRYEVGERLPRTRDGVWRRTGVTCNGEREDANRPASVRITAGRGAVCTFTNRLDRPGRISVHAVTIGGVGAAIYQVSPIGDPSTRRTQLARTTRTGAPTRARGQSTDELPFGRYVIQEAAAVPTDASSPGEWRLVAVVCGGRLRAAEQGRVVVRITRSQPVQRCTFIHARRPAPPPPSPTPVDPVDPSPAPAPGPVPGGDTPDLVLRKQQVRSTGGPAPTLTFRLRVTNRSDVTATRVVVADRLPTGMALVSVSADPGRCLTRGPRLAACAIGDLTPGATATVRVRAQQIAPGAAVNVAAAGTGSPERVLRNNVAAARIASVRRPPQACPSSEGPIARAAC